MRPEATVVLVVVTALVLIGVLAVYSVSAVKKDDAGIFQRHLTWLCLGLVCMLTAMHVDYHRFQGRLFVGALVVGTMLLLLYVLFFGQEIRGARRWIQVGFFQFQPSELAKIAAMVFLAVKLVENQGDIKSFARGFTPPFGIAISFAALIVLQPDLGIPVIIVAMAFVMMLVAGTRLRYLAASTIPVLAAVSFLIVAYPYRWKRIIAFLDPWKDPEGAGYHLIQSLAAFARGGLWGIGPGGGTQKLQYLPDAHTDFIFAVWAEETGLIGTLLAGSLFAILLLMAVRIAMCARDLFGSLLATGIVSLICLQALLNMAVTTGWLPTKGLPLPFISYGGTATLVFFTLIGILLNIGLQAEEPQSVHALAY